jgi:hypothetical protein
MCWQHLGKKREALELFDSFMSLRARWKDGVHSLEDAAKRIAEISEPSLSSMEEMMDEEAKELELV